MDNIRHSHSFVDQTRDQILGTLRQLQTKLEEVRHKQTRAKAEMDSLIAYTEL